MTTHSSTNKSNIKYFVLGGMIFVLGIFIPMSLVWSGILPKDFGVFAFVGMVGLVFLIRGVFEQPKELIA